MENKYEKTNRNRRMQDIVKYYLLFNPSTLKEMCEDFKQIKTRPSATLSHDYVLSPLLNVMLKEGSLIRLDEDKIRTNKKDNRAFYNGKWGVNLNKILDNKINEDIKEILSNILELKNNDYEYIPPIKVLDYYSITRDEAKKSFEDKEDIGINEILSKISTALMSMAERYQYYWKFHIVDYKLSPKTIINILAFMLISLKHDNNRTVIDRFNKEVRDDLSKQYIKLRTFKYYAEKNLITGTIPIMTYSDLNEFTVFLEQEKLYRMSIMLCSASQVIDNLILKGITGRPYQSIKHKIVVTKKIIVPDMEEIKLLPDVESIIKKLKIEPYINYNCLYVQPKKQIEDIKPLLDKIDANKFIKEIIE